MSLEIIFSGLIVAIEFLLSTILLFNWSRTEVKFFSDLPFLFGVSILSVGISGILNLTYLLTYFAPELIVFQIRGLLICLTGAMMILAILKIWLPENFKIVISGGLIYVTAFLSVILFSQTSAQIISYTSPFIAINVILVIITFSIVYLKRRLPMVNSPLVILGALIILSGQLSKFTLSSLGLPVLADLISIAGWCVFTSGFLIKASYFKDSNLTLPTSDFSSKAED